MGWFSDIINYTPVGIAINSAGDTKKNQENRMQARNQQDATTSMAGTSMDFQERMSNTSHQREVKDLESAGLNPLLSATGGATTPGGATGSVGGAPPVENQVRASITSALEAKNLELIFKKGNQEIKNMKSLEAESRMKTKTMSKDLPKADLVNRIYERIMRTKPSDFKLPEALMIQKKGNKYSPTMKRKH